MLKVFVSSTSRDLAIFRESILKQLDKALEGVGMENFIPKGITSQDSSIRNLRESDVVIFLISSYYGSLMETCVLNDTCKADCPIKKHPMKKGDKISYTHCEYKIALAEDKPHMTYLIDKEWEIIEFLKDKHHWDLNKLKKNDLFTGLKDKELKHYIEVSKSAWELNKEVNREDYKKIEDFTDPNLTTMIANHLAENIVEWYSDKKLNFTKFCNRRDELNELIKNINGKIEVYGVGGIGKTALIQVALLIQRLKGKEIITVGTGKSYASGSGYEEFRTKYKDAQHRSEFRNEITLYDIVNAVAKLLPDVEEVRKKPKNKIIGVISNFINNKENLILFIDDFHLANNDVKEFIKNVDNIIFSSRKNTHIARKEICIIGINEKDRNELIDIFSDEELPDKAKRLIQQLAEGHPVSTELLVKNYQRINFDKLKNFNLKNASETQVEDFYKRVVEDILSNEAFGLIKNLSLLNTDLETNIDRESVEKSYDINNIAVIFDELLDTGMLKKKEGKEGIYEFYFKHIQDALEDIADQDSHERAIEYYAKKKKIIGDNIDDSVEAFFHKVKLNPNEKLVDEFLEINKKILPIHYGFKRLIDVGEELKISLKDKALVLGTLGNLYRNLGRFEDSEAAYLEALETRKQLAEKNPEVYLPDVAMIQNNFGILYADLNRHEEAEAAYLEALEIRKQLAEKNPEAYLPDVAMTQNNLGNLYQHLNRHEEAEAAYLEALEIYKELAEKNPEAYLPGLAMTQNNLGNLYDDLNRHEEAEAAYLEALEIRKQLAEKNPEAYLPDVAMTQNNLGNLYQHLNRHEEAEAAYLEALEIYKELTEKNPEAYLPDVAMIQNNLGVLYQHLNRHEEAEAAYLEALEIYKELAEKNPEAFLLKLATIQSNLGTLYRHLNRHEGAEAAYLEALEICKQLAEKNPEVYLLDVAMNQYNLGNLYDDLNRHEEAEASYLEALEICKQLAEKNPELYSPEIKKIQKSLVILSAK